MNNVTNWQHHEHMEHLYAITYTTKSVKYNIMQLSQVAIKLGYVDAFRRPAISTARNNQTLGIDPLPWCRKHFEIPWPKFRPVPARFLRKDSIRKDSKWMTGWWNDEESYTGTLSKMEQDHMNPQTYQLARGQYKRIIWDNVPSSHFKDPFQRSICSAGLFSGWLKSHDSRKHVLFYAPLLAIYICSSVSAKSTSFFPLHCLPSVCLMK